MGHVWNYEEPELPRPTWYRFLQRLWDETDRDQIMVIGASVAYFGFIALFPMMIALVSLVGLVVDPHLVERQMKQVGHLMPPGASELLLGQLNEIVKTAPKSLGVGLVLSLIGSLWGASSGAHSLIRALNVAYDSTNQRSFIRARGAALLIALSGILCLVLVGGVLVALPVLAARVETFGFLSQYLGWLRWVLAAALIAFSLALVYRYAPCRPVPRWRWITAGAVVATLLWLAVTGLFSLYVGIAGNFQQTYGALASVVVLLLWMYLSSVSVLLGAEVDSTVEWVDRGFRTVTHDETDPSLTSSGTRPAATGRRAGAA